MRRTSRLLVAGLALLATGCGDRPKTKTKYVDSYLDILITPDVSCNQSLPICVYALETHLVHEGAEIVVECTDVVPALGGPAQIVQDLQILAGTAIAGEVPASGLLGVELRAYGQDCETVGQGGALPFVFAGYAEIELSADDQQLAVPVSCSQPQEPC